ncbi:glutathione S-transferase family protein [soil metagenome]
MITLYAGGARFGLPEVSPFVTKTEVQLQMLGLDYHKEEARPDSSPKGQLPWIDDDGMRIGDSHFIRLHLAAKYGGDLDAGLTERQRAAAWTAERMVEDGLRGPATYFRWLVPENFVKGPAHFFDDAPEAVRAQITAEVLGRVIANLKAQGVARHSEAEIVGMGVRSLAALSVLMGDSAYLMGKTMCGADASVFGFLAMILTPFFDSELRTRALEFTNLTAYVDRMMGQFYPDFAWQALPKAA